MSNTNTIFPRRQAFTLTEMIIAVTIGVVIMLGVNQIFQTTSNTITSGLALAEINRNLRGAQATFYNDIRGSDVTAGMAPIRKGPSTQPSPDDGSAQTNTAPFLFIYCHNVQADLSAQEQAAGASKRTYRSDILSFFSSGQFKRQTSDGSGMIPSGTTTNQAYIAYGHLDVPSNTFASSWVLGRNVILLGGPASGLGGQSYYVRSPTASPPDLAPLAVSSNATDGSLIQDSRYDLAATDFGTFGGLVKAAISASPGAPDSKWAYDHFNYHFNADPTPKVPLTSASLAKSIPPFILNCTDFAVDFAGDFNQDGQIDTGTDGQIQWYGLPRPAVVNGVAQTGRPIDSNVKTVGSVLGPKPFEYQEAPDSSYYCCAWGAGDGKIRPKLIRITVSVTDAKGRVNLPVTHQYVFSVP